MGQQIRTRPGTWRFLIGLIVFVSIAGLARASDPNDYKAGELLVRFAEVDGQPPSWAEQNSILCSILPGCFVSKEYPIVPGLSLVELVPGTTVEDALPLFNQSSSILYAEPNYKLKLAAIPNDPRFGELWGMHNMSQTGGTVNADIDAPEAWNIATGSSSIIVAVQDTGVDYTHPDLVANMWVNTTELNGDPNVDDDGNGYVDDVYGYDFVNSDSDPMDDNNHGTHVSGTIGAVGNNSEGVAGVCWTVRIMALKIFDATGGSSDFEALISDAIESIEYARDNGAKVINASWGAGAYSQSLYDAIDDIRKAGMLFVAAAHNYSFDIDEIPIYPASYDLDNIISVMATNHNDNMTYYSNYGAISVDLAAPGGEQYFTSDPGGILSCIIGGGYDFYQGTSMATPHVAGACALMWSTEPSLTRSEIKYVLLNTVDKIAGLEGLCVSEGRLNLFEAVDEVEHDTMPPDPDPAEWDVEPAATGVQTIYMEAKKATDRSGVKYYFKCFTDSNFDSGWQSNTIYEANGFADGSTYTFGVKARDLSEAQNETGWSDPKFTTTASPNDILPPAPNPSRWAVAPRKFTETVIGMAAKISSDENGPVQYYFECTAGGAPDSGWQIGETYLIPGLGYGTYSFKVKARDALHNETIWSDVNSVTLAAQPMELEVPSPLYPTIQSAINAANAGDTVLVRSGTYTGLGNRDLDFSGAISLPITVRSYNPEDPDVVATTIIDCGGTGSGLAQDSHRAFDFHSGEGLANIVAGFTIRNGYIRVDGADGAAPGGSGQNGQNSFGGAISCTNSSSPTIRNCIIINCVAEGGYGGDGAPGEPNEEDPPSSIPGGNGGNGGMGAGGAIYCDGASNPIIKSCTIDGCSAIGGAGGDGGNGEPDGGGGFGGNGGSAQPAYGGAIYCGPGNSTVIVNCEIVNSSAIHAEGGIGGTGNPPGVNGFASIAHGGGVYYDINCQVNIDGTEVRGNQADNDGGGIYCDHFCIVDLSGCSVSDNSALAGNGGGIWSLDGTLTLDDCDLSGNSTTSYGGGIYAGTPVSPLPTGAQVTINNSDVVSNTAFQGGGACLVETVLTISDSDIIGNTADHGGGVYWVNSDANVINCTISDNSATGGAFGSGAGFYCDDSSAKIWDCVFTGNEADGSGGAVSFIGGINQYVTNCLVTDNAAFLDGAGFSCVGAMPILTNCTIVGNEVSDIDGSGGGVSCYDTFVEIVSSILWDNSAVYGPQISIGDPLELNNPATTVMLSYSDVEGGADDVFIGEPAGIGPWLYLPVPASVLDEDPMFVQVSVIDPISYYLSQYQAGQILDQYGNVVDPNVNPGDANSPCIDTGDPGSTLDTTALTTRTDYVPDTGIVNMGYHYQVIPLVNRYQLIIGVVNEAGGSLFAEGRGDDPFIIEDPNARIVTQGTVVLLRAVPNLNWVVRQWIGTDNDTITDVNNTVTMDRDRSVTVEFEQMYKLTILVPGGGGVVIADPNGPYYPPGTVVTLTAIPDAGYRLESWSGTDNDASTGLVNTVTMDDNKLVVVGFGEDIPVEIFVPGDSDTISQAVDMAYDGDKIIVLKGTHSVDEPGGLDFKGKSITIMSEDPNNASTVAQTIIDCNGYRYGPQRAFQFRSGEGPNSVLTGFTIKRGFSTGPVGCSYCIPQPPQDLNEPNDTPAPGGGDGIGDGYGGAIYIEGSSPTILNCVITDCIVTGGVGGDGAPGLDAFLRPDTDDGQWAGPGGNGYGDGYGGAIYCDSNSSPLIKNCVIMRNTARGGLGGNGGNGGTAEGSGMAGAGGDGGNGEGNGHGGSIFAAPGSKATIVNCTFKDNKATTSIGGSGGLIGGGNTEEGGETVIFPGVDGFSAGVGFGGVIYVGANSEAGFSDCLFEDNRVRGYFEEFYFDFNDPDPNNWIFAYTGTFSDGGALYCDVNSTVSFANCTFTGNFVGETVEELEEEGFPLFGVYDSIRGSRAGAMYCADNSKVSITNCTFTNNSNYSEEWYLAGYEEYEYYGLEIPSLGGELDGGAIYFGLDSIVDINDTIISGNRAHRSGGGVYSRSSAIALTGCIIGGNTALNGDAGGFYLYSPEGTVLTMTGCTIAENIADGTGGGVYWKDVEVNSLITKCRFLDNQANRAAGLYVVSSKVDMNDCVVKGNIATGDIAGGLWTLNTSGDVNNCTFADNMVTSLFGSGGAISMYGNSPNISNCLFAGNFAGDEGGAITSGVYSEPNIINCTFKDNVANNFGGGVYCDDNSAVTITNCIFAHCNGSAVYKEEDANSLSITHSVFWENYASDFNNFIDVPANQNLFADPEFVSGVLGDFYLDASESPCVDAGDGLASDWGLDARTTRVDNAPDKDIVDIGYHYVIPSVQYHLTVVVIGGNGTVSPSEGLYYEGAIVELTAQPTTGYRVEQWSGTTNDGSTSKTAYVVMDSDRVVTVQFGQITTHRIPDDYNTLQRAIDAAKDGDIVEVAPGHYRHPGWEHGYVGPHLGGIVLWGKNLTITSSNPDNPSATTLEGLVFEIRHVGPETLITGFTMVDMNWVAASGVSNAGPRGGGYNGSYATGGAMSLYNASPTIVNVVIDNVSITAGNGGNGGGGLCPGGNGGWGGAAYGGAIYMENSSPTLKGVRITNCSATGGNGGNGGDGAAGCYGGRGGSWDFVGDPNDPNKDEDYWEELGLGWEFPEDRFGNARYDLLVDSQGNIIATIPFRTYDYYWMYSGMGGAIYADANSNPTFIGCYFADNYSSGGYCGVGGDGAQAFPWPDYHHRIENFGGGIFCEAGSSPTFVNCTFGDNYADSNVPTENHTPYISYGGGLCVGLLTPVELAGKPKLEDCSFIGNSATVGGGIFWADTAPTITDNDFNDNYAYEGGAIFFSNIRPLILGCSFTENDVGYEYVPYFDPNNPDVLLDPNLYFDVDFGDGSPFVLGPPVSDVLGLGAGIFCLSSPAHIADCNFSGNTSSGSGGGAYLEGDLPPDANSVMIHNCLFTGNTAAVDGGGITCAFNVWLNLSNCTLTGNEVSGIDPVIEGCGGGLSCTYSSNANVINSIIWGNSANIGREIAVGGYDPNENYFEEDLSELTVAYSDVWGEQQEAFIRPGEPQPRLHWVKDGNGFNTNIHDNPLFFEGYHLSQPDTGDSNQVELSSCVDAGSDDAYSLGMYRHTTRTNGVLDAGIVDMGYHYVRTVDLVCDYNFDGVVNGSDHWWFLLRWLHEDCSFPDWCAGADLNRDGRVNNRDYAMFAQNYKGVENVPPEPNPMMWARPPYSGGSTSITMDAVTAFDNSTGWNVEYYFQCLTEGGHDSVWQSEPTYTDTGLVTGNTYWYTVKARDENGNETEPSIEAYAVPGADTTPPVTDPDANNPYQSMWAEEPYATSLSSISMTVVAAMDDTGPVEYYFAFVSSDGNDGNDSGWQESTTYEDIGLDPNTTYTYRVRARDKAEPPNYGSWSDLASASTVGDFNAPTPDPNIEDSNQYYDVNDGYYHHSMTCTVCADVSGPVEYYFECYGYSAFNSGWITENTWDVAVALNPVQLWWRVRARDQVGNMTAWSEWQSIP